MTCPPEVVPFGVSSPHSVPPPWPKERTLGVSRPGQLPERPSRGLESWRERRDPPAAPAPRPRARRPLEGHAVRASPPLRSFPSAVARRDPGRRGDGAGPGAASPAPPAGAPTSLPSPPGQACPKVPGTGPRRTPATLLPPPLSAPHPALPRAIRDHTGSSVLGWTCSSARIKPWVLSANTNPLPAPR